MSPNPRRSVSAASLAPQGETVIIGGGIMGLGLAYELARRGRSDVHVLEQSYLTSGASGRNGGGVRMQWSTELNVRLMQESIDICRDFASELGINVWFRQDGYLFLTRTETELAHMERNVALQNKLGVPTRILSPKEAQKIVPELDARAFSAACYNPLDGVVFPWPFLWGYAQAAAEMGVQIHTFTQVTGIDVRGPHSFVVQTSKGPIAAERVINAAGAWSPEVAKLVGVTLPNSPHRHEILATEPLKFFLKPLCSVIGSGLYFSQSMRGEIIGGITLKEPDTHQVRLGSSLRFLEEMSAALVQVMPILSQVRVLRQWAGPYDVSPDGLPILGEPDGLPGFHLLCGFMGHGFMMAPVMARLYAEFLCGGKRHEVFDKCKLSRFAQASTLQEVLIIG